MAVLVGIVFWGSVLVISRVFGCGFARCLVEMGVVVGVWMDGLMVGGVVMRCVWSWVWWGCLVRFGLDGGVFCAVRGVCGGVGVVGGGVLPDGVWLYQWGRGWCVRLGGGCVVWMVGFGGRIGGGCCGGVRRCRCGGGGLWWEG